MPPILPGSVDALNKFEDLSGVDSKAFSNPYDALIEACQNDPVIRTSHFSIAHIFWRTFLHNLSNWITFSKSSNGWFLQKEIQSRYSTHRIARNAKQKADLLSPDFKGLILDSILQKLETPSLEPGFVDPRNSLVLWARPPSTVSAMISKVQQRLKVIAPSLYFLFHLVQTRSLMVIDCMRYIVRFSQCTSAKILSYHFHARVIYDKV